MSVCQAVFTYRILQGTSYWVGVLECMNYKKVYLHVHIFLIGSALKDIKWCEQQFSSLSNKMSDISF